MNSQLVREWILRGEFHEAAAGVRGMSHDALEGELMQIAFDEGSMSVYLFVLHLLAAQETSDLHTLASSLLIHPFCHHAGAYFASRYHVERAMALAPADTSVKELMLFLADVPDLVVSKEEANRIAEEILALKPDHKAARAHLSL